jgi:outer membrane receptor protein involved in Fe transport
VDYDELTVAPTFSTGQLRQDYGFDVGGYIVRDKLWFFVAYNVVEREDKELISEVTQELYGAPEFAPTDRTEDQSAAKLTWNVSSNHSLVGSYFGDPEDWVGANGYVILGGTDTWANTRVTGGTDYTLKYMGLPSSSILLNAQWAHHEEEDSINPNNSTDIQYQDRRLANEFRTGGIGGFYAEEYTRDAWSADLTWYADAAGSHEIKIGYGEQSLEANKANFLSGGQQVWLLNCSESTADCSLALDDPDLGPWYYAHEVYLNSDATLDNWTPQPGYAEAPTTDNKAVFLQDSWRVLSNLTLNFGIRWEDQSLRDGAGREWIHLDDNWAPRIGAVWDIGNNGRSKLYAHYGQFFENIPMDINIRFMGKEVDGFFYNTDPLDLNPNNDLRPGRIRGSSSVLEIFEMISGSAVDPDMVGQSIDEIIVGYEVNLLADWTFGVSGVFRKLNDVIEDGGFFAEGVGYGYIVGNGGKGFLSVAPDLEFTDVFPLVPPKLESPCV